MIREETIKHFESLQKRYTTQHNGKHCEYVKEALEALRKRTPQKPTHIHEVYPKHQWKRDKDGGIDTWAWEAGYHNGPTCERCGTSPCEHCEPDYDDEECVVDEYRCPNCEQKLYKYKHKTYCDDCGQAIDWEE